MDGTEPRNPDPDAVAADAARLARAVERFGAVRLSRQPDLCRNVLGDLFPEDRLAARLLTAAAAERVPERLAERGEHVDPRMLVPQLAADLAEARGLRDDYALRAVHTWTAALGISLDATPEPVEPVQEEPEPTGDDRLPEPLEVHQTDPGSLPTRVRTDVPGPAEPAAEETASAEATDTERRPRRSLMLVAAAAGAVILLVISGIGIALAITSGSPAVAVAALGDASGRISGGDGPRSIGGSTGLEPGRTVTASRGLLEVTASGGAVIRLDEGARVAYRRAATDAEPARFELLSGRIYVNTAGERSGTQAISITTPAGRAEVKSGRLMARCSGSTCVWQALEERQTVVPETGASIALDRHQRVTTGAGQGSDPKPDFTAPDLLREDSWVAHNLHLDQGQSRTSAAISGERLIGEWAFGYDSTYVSGRVWHPVRIERDCEDGPDIERCELEANTVSTTCPGQEPTCPIAGPVEVSDARGGRLSIVYENVRTDCDGDTRRDGVQTLTDRVTLSEGGLSGTRTAKLTPEPGQICGDEKVVSDAFREQSFPIEGERGAIEDSRFPQAGWEERLLTRFVSYATCSRAASRESDPAFGEALAAVSCTYSGKDRSGNTRPRQVEFVLFPSAATQAAAYRSVARSHGLSDTGTCGVGVCERPFSSGEGRKLIFKQGGKFGLAAYLPDLSRILLIASGSNSAKAVDDWYLSEKPDYGVKPYLVTGL